MNTDPTSTPQSRGKAIIADLEDRISPPHPQGSVRQAIFILVAMSELDIVSDWINKDNLKKLIVNGDDAKLILEIANKLITAYGHHQDLSELKNKIDNFKGLSDNNSPESQIDRINQARVFKLPPLSIH